MTARYLLRGQLSYLHDSGFEVHLLCAPGEDLAAVERREGVVSTAIPLQREIHPVADFRALVALVRALRSIEPDIVCAGTPKAGLLGMAAAAFLRCPHRIYLVRGLRLETTRGGKRALLLAAERFAARCAHRVALVSPSLQREWLRLGISAEAKTVVLGPGSSNGVDIRRFAPSGSGQRPEVLRSAIGLEAGSPIIGFVGRLVRDKGVEDLIDAFRDSVLPRFPTARLLLLGGFEEGDPVSLRIRDLVQQNDRIVSPGLVPDTAPWYRLMDVLAFPSYREGFPNVPLEAAASSLAVVGYGATGTVDAVVQGVTGTLVAVGDRRALGEVLCRYLRDPEVARRQGAAGRQRAVDHFARERIWAAWRDFYFDLLGDQEQDPAR